MIDLVFLLVALFMGFKHSIDIDQIPAVSALVSKSKNKILSGLFWAFSHILASILILSIIWFLGFNIIEAYHTIIEILAALSLILIGVYTLYFDEEQEESEIFKLGIINGFVTNDEVIILLLTGLGVVSIETLLTGITLFSIGIILGVLLLIYSLSVISKLTKHVSKISAVLSIIAGLLLLIL